IRQWGIDATIMVGGPYGTSGYDTILQDQNIDLAVLGEGEETFGELVRQFINTGGNMPTKEVLKGIKSIAFIPREEKARKHSSRDIIMLDALDDLLAGKSGKNPAPANHSNDLAYVLFTSGSTGTPKGTLVEHRNVVRLVKNTNFVDFAKGGRIMQTGALEFDASTFEIWGALLNGLRLYLIDTDKILTPRELKKAVREYGITTMWMTSPLFNRMSTADIEIFEGLENLLVGGDILSPSHINRLRHRFPRLNVINGYGPTENTTFSATYRINKDYEKSIPLGKPIANSTAYVVDPRGGLLPKGVIGELWVGGDGVTRGYLNKPELTAEKFVETMTDKKFYRTGDRAAWRPDGELAFFGRVDHQVKIRGYRIEPGEIECRLLQHDAVQDAVVVEKDVAEGGKNLVAYFVPVPGEGSPASSELRTFLLQELPDFMVPAHFVSLETLPLTPNGKIDRKALPQPLVRVTDHFVAPGDDVERKMVAVWADVLGVNKDTISIDADFFEMGGHSLNATVLAAEIHKTFDVSLPIAVLFKYSRVKELSERVKGMTRDNFISIPLAEKKKSYCLSSAQKRLYILHRMAPDSIAYNIPNVVRLEAEIDLEKLRDTFKELTRRHESLRTAFKMVDETPQQEVLETVELVMENIAGEGTSLSADEAGKAIRDFVRPFDLQRPPLMRLGIVKGVSASLLLVIDMHHIITDGVSHDILVRESRALYDGEELPPLHLQYKDYAEWRNLDVEKNNAKEQERYWKNVFAGEVPVLELPTDYIRPPIRSVEGACEIFVLDEEDTPGLENIAAKTEASLFMVLLSVFYVLLGKLSGAEDIVVGSPVAGRRHADLRPIVGMFVNTLALRNAPTDDIPFDYFLDRLKNNTLEAFDNQEFPFEELVEQVFFTRDLSRNPLFDVMFTLRSEEGIGKDMEGHPDADDYNDLYRISKFDLLLTAVTAGERLEFQLQYCTRLFTRETIRGFVRFFKTIVAAVIKKPGTRIADIPLINDEEKIRLLHSFNSSDTGYRLEKNLFREFADQVKRKPHQMAVVYEECELSYLQLYKQACRLGVMLRHKGGEPGSVVGIMAHRATETIAGIMGILAGGCAYLPIDPQFPTNRKRYMMADSNADLLLDCRVHNHDRPAADAWSENRVLFIDDIAVESRDWEDISQAADYPAYVLYTSGSSGKPKGVLVEHRSVLNLVEELKKRIYRFQSPVHTALISPFVFDASIKQVFPSLLLGHTLVIVPEAARFDGEALIRCYKEKDVRVCDGTPAHMSIMLNYPHLLGAGFPVEQFVVGGEELAYNLCRSFMNTVARKDFKIVNVYGPTECCDVSTSHIVTAESLRDGRPIPVGTPLGNVRCLIMGRNGDVQPAGIPGELCISGAGVARGYLNQPELTAEKFVLGETNGTGRGILTPPTFYRTGDLARQLPDGNFEFLRRLDRQVKIRGFRIELGEIRNRLTSMDIIKDAVVIDAKREGKSGEKFLCAYVIPAAGQEIDVNKIKELLARELPRYMIPAAFVLLQELPLTDVGKIDRRALPTPQIEGTNRYTPPENDTEEILAEIWSDVLEIKKEKISTDADFFELGGHSLKATIIIAKIHKKLDIKVPLAEVFNAPTIRRLALYLQAAKRDSFVHIGTAHIDHHYPLSSAQKGLFFQQLLNPLSTAYNMPQTMRLSGDVDNERLETVFKKLIRRHESFRSSFHIIEEMPAQIVHPEVAFAIKIFNVGHEGEAREIVDGFVKPFNLEHAPLLRVGVIEVKSGDGCIVMVDSHHIITDGVSQAILETEFDHLFRGGELPPLRIQYKDYAVWQNSCIMRDTKKLQGAFWKKEFDGEVPQLTLPADYQRPAVKSLAGAHLNYRVEREMTSLLKQLARETGTTLFMVLLSSYYILLARYSRQEDIVVGSPITGRRHADLQNIIGMFINMMAIRNRPRATMTFASFLAEVKEKVLKSMENQDYHFEELVSELKVKVNPGRNPLFDAIFSMQNIEFQNPGNIDTNAATDSMKVASYGFESGVSRFDLTVNAIEADGTVQLAVEFSTELFQKSTIECMMAHYLEILEQVVREREIKLEDIVLSHQLVAAGSDILREEEGDFEL
ncbi:MAG: amino acid adenylation domain-containing protein, partial [bacterium]|nr:amino acid adenylation domain-containing protein [bacterium]